MYVAVDAMIVAASAAPTAVGRPGTTNGAGFDGVGPLRSLPAGAGGAAPYSVVGTITTLAGSVISRSSDGDFAAGFCGC
ncbi:hypothetical protein [Actinoalloteichus sp. GBA129-24]|uniref:hypothetical protein n=1 Tax=Actinoalloteichus sp. GBA129-24 TaxID=1612551 RepID=UPI0012FAD8DC|nr:hypothetical protein [Actinoalloteichus sp. GBA129-24]